MCTKKDAPSNFWKGRPDCYVSRLYLARRGAVYRTCMQGENSEVLLLASVAVKTT
jgi:hypothetical protein